MTFSGLNLRRLILKAAPAIAAAPALWLMNSLARRADELPENANSIQTVPLAPGNGVRFYGKVIVVANAQGLSVFSSRCPHLGCLINREENGEIVCPCHGSRFDAQGQAVHGPAEHNLRPLAFDVDRANSVLRVTLNREQDRSR